MRAFQLLAGCSSPSLIVGENEVEQNAGVTLGLYALPGAELKAFYFKQEQVEEANGPGYWQLETGVEPAQTNGWLVFIDPFHLDSEAWLRTWNEAYAPLPVLGRAGQRRLHRASHPGLSQWRGVRGGRRRHFRAAAL